MKRGLVAYDITIDRYRNKLSKLLSGYGERVQLSIFEFELEEDIYAKLIQEIDKLYREYIKFAYMKGNLNDVMRSIRIYIICSDCMKKVLIFDKKHKDNKRCMVI